MVRGMAGLMLRSVEMGQDRENAASDMIPALTRRPFYVKTRPFPGDDTSILRKVSLRTFQMQFC